ncbi:MAG: acyl carrier protein [Polyangiaceae bacterium]|nr:acyl carrier protein [Polyangiaceae bacterium]
MAEMFSGSAVESFVVKVFSKYKQGNAEVGLASVITADLGVDSLAVMEIVAELEDAFGLAFPDEDLPNIKTVGDVAALIVRCLEDNGRLQK